MPIGAANSSSRRGTDGNVSCGTVESTAGLGPPSAWSGTNCGITETSLFTNGRSCCMIRPPKVSRTAEAAGSLRFRSVKSHYPP